MTNDASSLISDESGKYSTGAFVGGIIGASIGGFVAGALIMWVLMRKRIAGGGKAVSSGMEPSGEQVTGKGKDRNVIVGGRLGAEPEEATLHPSINAG